MLSFTIKSLIFNVCYLFIIALKKIACRIGGGSIKTKVSKIDENVKTKSANDCPESNEQDFSTKSIVDDIKNAAHEAQQASSFIYEPTSGLYYDSRTGYYYNAVSEHIS